MILFPRCGIFFGKKVLDRKRRCRNEKDPFLTNKNEQKKDKLKQKERANKNTSTKVGNILFIVPVTFEISLSFTEMKINYNLKLI